MRKTGSRQRRSILLVEDHPETLLLYREHFERAGYYVETAANGNAAIDGALRGRPDLIVLDLAMPQLDGWDTVALLHSYPATRAIPVVACSAIADDGSIRRAIALGCTRFVKKPCLPEDLERVVDDVLDDEPTSGAASGVAASRR